MSVAILSGLGLLGLVLIGCVAASLNTRLQRRRRMRLYEKMFMRSDAAGSQLLALDARVLRKAGRVLSKFAVLLRMIDYEEEELKFVFPLLCYLEGCVYSADLDIERQQREGAAFAGGQRWRESITGILKAHDLYDPRIDEELDQLVEYWRLESQLVRGESMDEETVLRAFYMRFNDLALLLRVGFRMKEMPDDEVFLRAIRPLIVLEEFRDDLESYEEDIKNNSFNILRLLTRLHGKDAAKAKLRELQERMLVEGGEGLRTTKKRYVVRYYAHGLADLGIPYEASYLFYLLPKSLLIRMFEALTRLDWEASYGVMPAAILEP